MQITPQQRLDEAEPWVFDVLATLTCDEDATTPQRNQAFKRLMSVYGMSESLAIIQRFIVNGYHA